MIVTDIAATQILQIYFTSGSDFFLRLYANNYTPVDGSILTDFVEIPVGCGYSEWRLFKSSFVITTIGGIPTATYAERAFTFTGPMTGGTYTKAYGWYVVDSLGNVLFAQRSAASFTPTTNGEQIKVTLQIPLSGGIPV